MRTSQDLTVRIVSWFLVIATAVPMPVLAADSCGCVIDSNGGPIGNKVACCCCAVACGVSEATENCSQQRSDGERLWRKQNRTCCIAVEALDNTEDTCTVCGDSGCTCGLSCKCRSGSEPRHATPPVEDGGQTRHTVSHSPCFACPAPVNTLRNGRSDAALAAEPLAALQRCISLCRFTL